MKHIFWRLAALLLGLSGGACQAGAQPAAGGWDPQPWVEDLAQIREAFETKYANYSWLRDERELDLAALFPRVETRLREAGSDAAARALLDRMIQRIGDGHVALRWPRAAGTGATSTGAAPAAPADAAGFCRAVGYGVSPPSPGIAAALDGYAPLGGGNAFPAGIVTVEGRKVGVLRIGIFQPQGTQALCEGAVAALAIPLGQPCDEGCQNRIITWAYARMTGDFEERLRQLRAAGAETLLVDISDNGGGSEWAEAAARMLTPVALRSAPIGFVRGEHWARQWRNLAATLRQAAAADRTDRQRLLAWAAEADEALRLAQTPCGADAGCDRIGRAGFATGLVGEARSGSFDGKDWAVHVFSISQFPYHDGVWQGPLVVLVNEETWSAAEQFAALLRDNGAAIILGSRTGGAGCGHTWGGTPTVLRHSGATLELPDCVRFRRDGSNEVRGLIPDVLVGMRREDGRRLKARLVGEVLPRAVLEAAALRRP